MEFEGWESNQSRMVWTRHDGSYRAVVSRIDGWNWGWAILADTGEIIAGWVDEDVELADAIKAANAVLDGGI